MTTARRKPRGRATSDLVVSAMVGENDELFAKLMQLHVEPGELVVWHRPGDPTELAIGAPGGQWLELYGSRAQRREQIGNAVPPAAAQAIAERALELLDAGDEQVFRLSSAGIWVHPIRRARRQHRPWTDHAQHQHAHNR